MPARVRSIIAALRRQLQELYGPRLDRVVLFGSHARGDAGADSDIDVLVVLHGEVDPGEEIGRTGFAVSSLSLQGDFVISCLFMSSDRYDGVDVDPLLMNVRREGVLV